MRGFFLLHRGKPSKQYKGLCQSFIAQDYIYALSGRLTMKLLPSDLVPKQKMI